MLKKIRELTYRYAIASSILIAILFFLLLNGTVLIFHFLPSSMPMQYAQEIFVVLYSVGFVILLGFKDTFKIKGLFKGLLYSTTIIVLMLISLGLFFDTAASNPDTVWASAEMIIFGLVQAIVIGVREECFFRGAVQNILAKKYASSVKGVWGAAVLGAVIFGMFHLINIFSGFDPLIVCMQALSATGTGLFFAAIYLRSRNLWAAVLVHALIDTVALAGSIFLKQTRTEVVNSLPWESLFGMVIYIVPAVFLLRPSKCKEIVVRLEAEDKENLPEPCEINLPSN